MVKYLTIIIIGIFLILLPVAVGLFEKFKGVKKWWLGLIPIYCFFILGKYTKRFELATIPIKKFGMVLTELLLILSLIFIVITIGEKNLNSESSMFLNQIMYIPLFLLLIVFYIIFEKGIYTIYTQFTNINAILYSLISLIIISVPILLIIVALKNKKIEVGR